MANTSSSGLKATRKYDRRDKRHRLPQGQDRKEQKGRKTKRKQRPWRTTSHGGEVWLPMQTLCHLAASGKCARGPLRQDHLAPVCQDLLTGAKAESRSAFLTARARCCRLTGMSLTARQPFAASDMSYVVKVERQDRRRAWSTRAEDHDIAKGTTQKSLEGILE
jgi:hypothetical protein